MPTCTYSKLRCRPILKGFSISSKGYTMLLSPLTSGQLQTAQGRSSVPRKQTNLMTESPCFPPRTADINFLTSEERTRISNAARTERDAGNSRRRAAQWHDDTLRSLLRHKTDDRSRLWLTDLLQNLTADYGLGWSDLARMVGVSVPAVRKWRHGGDIAPARFNNLALLAAFLGLLTDEGVADPVTWLNLPIDDLDLDDRLSAESITKKEVYIAGGIVDLL